MWANSVISNSEWHISVNIIKKIQFNSFLTVLNNNIKASYGQALEIGVKIGSYNNNNNDRNN
jgi:hypothetical protein